MRKLISIFIISSLLFNTSYAFADEAFKYEENKPLTPQEVKIWKYKMNRITIRNESGKWEIIQGINNTLTDIQLLRLVNSERIGIERIEGVEFKQGLGNGILIVGLLAMAAGGVLVSNVLKFNNSFSIGVGSLAGGAGLVILGNVVSPVISDEADHIITAEEAMFAAETYNKYLRESMGIKDDVD